tara:strand:+ start:333 stop:530 length:198 start_codon:yes stop_codon:yes gene_type:complete
LVVPVGKKVLLVDVTEGGAYEFTDEEEEEEEGVAKEVEVEVEVEMEGGKTAAACCSGEAMTLTDR